MNNEIAGPEEVQAARLSENFGIIFLESAWAVFF